MHSRKLKDKFIEMRAEGLSLLKIARDLQVSKQTLIDWGKEFEFELSNMKTMHLDALQERYFISKRARTENLGVQLQRVREELKKRDLSTLSTDKLYDVYLKLTQECNNIQITNSFKVIGGVNLARCGVEDYEI
jgi:transposase